MEQAPNVVSKAFCSLVCGHQVKHVEKQLANCNTVTLADALIVGVNIGRIVKRAMQIACKLLK
jgi:hypothetical protein